MGTIRARTAQGGPALASHFMASFMRSRRLDQPGLVILLITSLLSACRVWYDLSPSEATIQLAFSALYAGMLLYGLVSPATYLRRRRPFVALARISMAFSPVYAAIVSKTVRMESSLSSRWAYDGGSLGAWAVLGVSSRGMALGIVPLAMRLPLHMLWWVQLIMLAAVARETAVEMCQAPIAAAPAVVGLLGTIHSAMDATAALLPFPWMSRAAWAFEPEAPWATFVAVSLFSQCLCAALPVASALLTDANVVRKAKRSRPTTTRSSMSQASGSARRRSSLSRTAVSSFDSTVVAWVAEHLDTVELFPMQVGLMASAVLGMLWVLLRWTAWRLCPAATSAAQYASL